MLPFFQQPSLGQVRVVAAGADFSMVLLQDGRAFAWGNNRSGQLGLGILTAKILPLLPNNNYVEIAEVVAGGALASTEKVSAHHRIVGFQSALAGYPRHTVGEGDCAAESTLGPLGIWGLLEGELHAFARVEQHQVERMQRRKDMLERVLHMRYRGAVARFDSQEKSKGKMVAWCARTCQVHSLSASHSPVLCSFVLPLS
jgi:hypothetical protein